MVSRFLLPYGMVIAVIAFFALLFGFFKTLEPFAFTTADDPYFHARYAMEIEAGRIPHLPYDTTLTLYGEGHSLYFGYHFLLSSVVRIFADPALPESAILPLKLFHAFLAGLFFGVFYLIAFRLLKRNGGRLRDASSLALLFTVILYGISFHFAYRLFMERPHILAMTLTLCVLEALIAKAWKRLFFVTFLLPFCYSMSIIALVPIGVYLLAVCITESKPREGIRAPLIGTLSGMVLGILLHPQPLNYFYNAIYVHLWVLWSGLHSSLPKATELNPYAFSFVDVLWAIPFAVVLIDVGISSLRQKRFVTPPLGATLLLSSLLFFVAMVRIERSVEYFMPFFMLAALWYVGWLRESRPPHESVVVSVVHRLRITRAMKSIALVCIAGILFGATAYTNAVLYYWSSHEDSRIALARTAGAILRTEARDGERVFLTAFGEYPLLYFYAPHLWYSQGIDPMFLFVRDPSRFYLGYHAYQSPGTICEIASCTQSTHTLYEVTEGVYGADYIAILRGQGTDPALFSFIGALSTDPHFHLVTEERQGNARLVLYRIDHGVPHP